MAVLANLVGSSPPLDSELDDAEINEPLSCFFEGSHVSGCGFIKHSS